MPVNNTSLDRFYKTTAHWDPWNQYRELINDEYQNGAKSQVIKRQFDGVKQYQEEKKRLTEGDKLLNLDVDKGIERFKKSVTDAIANLDQAKSADPLSDVFFNYNSLVVSYNTLTSVSSGQQFSQSMVTRFNTNLQSVIPSLTTLKDKVLRIFQYRHLLDPSKYGLDELNKIINKIQTGKGKYGGVDPPVPAPEPPAPTPAPAPTPTPAPIPQVNQNIDIKMPSISGMVAKVKADSYSYISDEALTIYFYRLKNIIENINSGNIALISNPTLSDSDRLYMTTARNAANVSYDAKQTIKTLKTATTKSNQPELEHHVGEHLPYMVNEVSLLKERIPQLTEDQLLKAYDYYKYLRDEAIGKNDLRKARQEQERISVLLSDQRLTDIFNTGEFPLADVLNPPILRGSANRLFTYDPRYPEVAYNDMSFGAAKPLTSSDKAKQSLSKLIIDRNVVYKQLLNKNIDQGEILALRKKKYLIEKAILTAQELLQSNSILQLDKYYQDITGMMPTTTPQTQPPITQPPRTQLPKTDIQPMIANAQQIIADETAVYNKKVAGTASADELKVKQESSANAIIPIFKAIFKVKPDEVQSLHAGIQDKEWKAMLLDRMPEINRPTDVIPFSPSAPPKPEPTPTPTPEPSPIEPAKDKNKLQADISAKIVEILPIYDAWDQEDTGNKNFLYKSIASICNSVLALLESGRRGGLNVKAEISLDAIGGNNVLNTIKDELWDDFTKGTPWNESDTIEVPTPFQFSQELVRLCKIVVSKQDEMDQLEEQKGKISEADIFNIVRPSVNDVIKYLIKGKKWYNNDIRRFKEYIVNTIAGSGTGKIATALNKLPDLIYSHGNAETLFDEQGDSGTKLPDLPDVSGAVFTSQIKSLVDVLNGSIDSWNEGIDNDDIPKQQQTQSNFYGRILNDVNKLIDKYIDRDRYEADGRFNRSFRNGMDDELNKIYGSKPDPEFSKGLKAKILEHAKDKTPFTTGGRRPRGRPAGISKVTKNVSREYKQINEFSKKSFEGLKKPIEGDYITDKLQKPFVLKNPGIGRVDKYREGAGKKKKIDYLHPSNVDKKREELIKSLMNKSGKGKVDIEIDTSDSDDEMPKKKTAGRKKVGHKKTKPTFTEI